MAKKKKDISNLSPEEQEKLRREEERKERDRREKEEQLRKIREKRRKEKLKNIRLRKKERAEKKRIKNTINFPFKILVQIDVLLTSFFFMIIFFGFGVKMYNALYYSFWVFVSVYGGIGGAMVFVFYLISKEKEKELEAIAAEEEIKMKEEEERLSKEQQELEENLREEYRRQQILLNQQNLADGEAAAMFDVPDSEMDEGEEGSDNAPEAGEGAGQEFTENLMDGEVGLPDDDEEEMPTDDAMMAEMGGGGVKVEDYSMEEFGGDNDGLEEDAYDFESLVTPDDLKEK